MHALSEKVIHSIDKGPEFEDACIMVRHPCEIERRLWGLPTVSLDDLHLWNITVGVVAPVEELCVWTLLFV